MNLSRSNTAKGKVSGQLCREVEAEKAVSSTLVGTDAARGEEVA